MSQPSILSTIAAINDAENDEAAFLIAATINLYTEALRRRAGRTIYSPSDAKALHKILGLVLTIEHNPSYKPAQRQIRPTPAEEKAILEAVEHVVDPVEELRRSAEGFPPVKPMVVP